MPSFLLPQPRDELFRRDSAHFLLLRGDRVEEVREAGEEGLLAAVGPGHGGGGLVGLALGLVLEDLLAEGLAEVECLDHAVRVAGVAELKEINEIILYHVWNSCSSNFRWV